MDMQTARRPASLPGTAADIRFCAVAKCYRGREVLRQVSFDVAPGTSTAIAGVNGAGKSTLLRCLLDFCQPDAGQILIQGRDHTQIGARTALGWLPERFVAPAHLNARETLQWLGGLRGQALDTTRLESFAARFGLDAQALKTRVRELSKGTSQKLGLISIGLSDCPIWVLDEPLSGLDAQARRTAANLIDEARRSGRTVLFSTHGLRELPMMSDQLVVLHDGAVRFCGSPQQFGARYATQDLEAALLACVDEQAATVARMQCRRSQPA
jgi:ABC-2 type transport system ATP-binding protein